MASTVAQAYNEGLGAEPPSRVQTPLVRGSEAERFFFTFGCPMKAAEFAIGPIDCFCHGAYVMSLTLYELNSLRVWLGV